MRGGNGRRRNQKLEVTSSNRKLGSKVEIKIYYDEKSVDAL